MNINSFLKNSIMFISVMFYFVFLAYITDYPEARFSNETNKCIEVVPKGDCDDLPEKYREIYFEK